ncbi:hypothetical protein F7725_020559 [Dissostichus mawsoni]|uniref:Prolyl 4-hydroxylase alpha subunit domain-containing protein n=1 Tax=Dissostichus mawsoni TaxID=36200 RepID=A0A7J5YEX1_DISMA|nr:hypothetical protein F7725_020559 [Dissostichus mawsoni]
MKYSTCVCFSWSLLTVAVIPVSLGEMYTSLLNVKQAISVERKLIDYLKTYIDHESERLEDVKRFYAKVSGLHTELYKGPATAMANPLVAFTLIKRLHSEWLNVVHSNEAQENTQDTSGGDNAPYSCSQLSPPNPPTHLLALCCPALRSSYEKEEADLPKLEDLQGAAKGLMRLQDVYVLQVASLVRGLFQRVTEGQPIDIYRPAVAYEQQDYYHSVQWLEESVRLFRGAGGEWIPENAGTLEDALDHLAFSHFKTGNISYALSLSQELLHHDPMNGRVLQNVEKYERLLFRSPPLSITDHGLKRPTSNNLRTRDTYETLCQTQGSQQMHFKNPRLFCDFFTNGNPGLLLLPVRREVLSLQPYVVLYHNFITDTEAEDIKTTAHAGDSAHSTVGKLDQKISMLTGLNVKHPYGEYLQVVNYGIGGHYEPHFDHATSPSSPVGKQMDP